MFRVFLNYHYTYCKVFHFSDRGIWVLSRFGKCSAPCVRSNYGLQQREMVCLTLNGEVMDQTHCGPLLKKTLKRECESTICATEWKSADWTAV